MGLEHGSWEGSRRQKSSEYLFIGKLGVGLEQSGWEEAEGIDPQSICSIGGWKWVSNRGVEREADSRNHQLGSWEWASNRGVGRRQKAKIPRVFVHLEVGRVSRTRGLGVRQTAVVLRVFNH